MHFYTIIIGLPSDILAREHAIERIESMSAHRFGGYTLTLAYGGWLNPATNLVERERSARLEIATALDPAPFVQDIGRELEQQQILLVQHVGTTTLVTIEHAARQEAA